MSAEFLKANWKVAAAAAAAVAVGLYFAFRSSNSVSEVEQVVIAPPAEKSTSAPAPEKKVENVETKKVEDVKPVEKSVAKKTAPAAGKSDKSNGITKEKMLAILNDMVSSIDALTGERHKKVTALVEQGKNPDEAQQEVNEWFSQEVTKLDETLQASHNVSQEDFLEAQTKFAQDPDVIAVNEKLREIFVDPEIMARMAEAAAKAPEHITEEEFIKKMKTHFEHMEKGFKLIMLKVRRDFKGKPQDRAQYTEFLLEREIPIAENAALEAVGLTKEEFESCLAKFASSPGVIQAMQESQMRLFALQQEFS